MSSALFVKKKNSICVFCRDTTVVMPSYPYPLNGRLYKCSGPQTACSRHTFRITHRITPSNIQSCLNPFLILNVTVMIKSAWDLHLCSRLPGGTSGNGYKSLHRGNMPTSKKKQQKKPLPFSLVFFSPNALIMTLLIRSPKKISTHGTRLFSE